MSLARQIVVVALSATLLSSCTYVSQRVFDEERTVPDGGQNGFGPRHVPVLNPGGAMYRPDDSLSEMSARAENPYIMNSSPQAVANYGRVAPAQNQPVVMAYQQAAPVAPVAAVPVPKISSYTPPKQLASGAYPALSATPPNPVRPTAALTKQNIQQMESERALADAARREITANPEVQSMQREAAGLSPVTPAPAPLKESSDSGLSKWLDKTFSGSKEQKVASAPTEWRSPDAAPVTKFAPVVPAQKATTTASMKPLEPIRLVPPPAIMDEDVADTEESQARNRIALKALEDIDNLEYGGRTLAENRYTARRMRATQ